jgi:DNA (cytosine-5)-methyltransferase 1
MTIPVIDIFAGPGGLGEGFSAYGSSSGERPFRIALSIEKDPDAHKTLKLRSFFRQFADEDRPLEYYDCLRGELSIDELYRRFPAEAARASSEAWQAELGATDFPANEVDDRIKAALKGRGKWVLIGGPPCQAYSLVGRSRMIPSDPEKYERDHRHFLYREYLRIIAVHQPPVFVLENVKGILSSKMAGVRIIERILADLQDPVGALPQTHQSRVLRPQYRLQALSSVGDSLFGGQPPNAGDYIIRCEDHGIPQARHRFILVGVRSDIQHTPDKLSNNPEHVNMWEAIKDLPRLRSRLSQGDDSSNHWIEAINSLFGDAGIRNSSINKPVRDEMKRVAARMTAIRSVGGEFVKSSCDPKWRRSWFLDKRLRGVCNHSSRSHIKKDLWRYFYAACFASVHGRSPNLKDFPTTLLPEHRNARRVLFDMSVVFIDRFRVQVKDRPSTTITSHIAKDGHYFIHPDPAQCRSLTVREAARLQTFPDNYYFVGGRTAQYSQVGNAVPPLLALQVAEIIYSLMQDRRKN